MWRAAPLAAAAGVCAAALSRWAGWPLVVPAAVAAVGAVTLWLYRYLNSRATVLSDRAAAAIDLDAGMHGELRSAGWFAARDVNDPWTALHLSRAANHLSSVEWTALYPPVPAGGSQVATAVLVVAAVVVALTFPVHVGARPERIAAAGGQTPAARPAAVAGPEIDPELQKALEALLAAAADGTLPTAEAIASDAELRDALAKLGKLTNAELLAAIQRALAANPDARTQAAAQNLKALADDAKRTAQEGTISKETLDALEKLSDEIELAKPDDDSTAEAADAASASSPQQGDAGEANAAAGSEEVSIQFAKSADPGGGAGMLMMSSENAQPGGPPGAGVGGAGSQDAAPSAGSIDAALKHEILEASQDNPGTDEDSEIRRKTEHGNARVQFTRGEAASFDRTRAAAPPPIPEARRQGVQTYFVRKSQQ